MVAGDAALLERCKSLRAELVRFDAALSSGEDCRALAEELARTEKACAAARARAAARVAECGSFRQGGFDDAADWLSRNTGSSRGEANAAIKTAEAAEKLPATKRRWSTASCRWPRPTRSPRPKNSAPAPNPSWWAWPRSRLFRT